MTLIRPTRAEVAEALGVPLVPEVGMDVIRPVEGASATGRRAVLLIIVDDTDAALARLRPLVHEVVGVGWALSPAEARLMVRVLQ